MTNTPTQTKPAGEPKGETMGDTTRGLYGKFNIERTDGKSSPGQKHDGCDYFVLDLTHDPFAWAALRAYATECGPTYPPLARDLWRKIEDHDAEALGGDAC